MKLTWKAWMFAPLVALSACAPPPPPGRVVVERVPPREVVEEYGVAPGPGYTWVRGFYRWDGGDYRWEPGHWAAPPRGYRTWVPGRWMHERRGWYFREGHWR